MSMGFDKSKFVFSETFNNTDGKTSGSGFMGILLGLVGSACMVAAMVGWFMNIPNVIEVMGKIIIVLSLSGALLGLRKFVGSKNGISVGNNGNIPNKDNLLDNDDIVLETSKPITTKTPTVTEKG